MNKEVTLSFNINGCPNKCRHCYLRGKPSKKMDLTKVEEQITKFKDAGYQTNVYSWYLEPDYPQNYKEFYEWEQEHSHEKHDHFELASAYRLVRDNGYAKWLKNIGVNKVQLTFFGLEKLTNDYTDRNAFSELISSINILLDNHIVPRIQYFVYSDTVKDLKGFIRLLNILDIEERCESFGEKFEFFVFQGSCTGRALELYDKWLTLDDLNEIPDYAIEKSKEYFNTKSTNAFLGVPEKKLFNELCNSEELYNLELNYIFNIDNEYDVYPNFGEPTSNWKLGNLLVDSVEDIINNYETYNYKVGNICRKFTIGELVTKVGDKHSDKLFNRKTYIEHIIEKILYSEDAADI